MNEKHIKDAKLITSIFNTFKEGSAIIAGGYPRDLQLGREPKDIDILVEWESKLDYDELRILADRLGYVVHDHSERYGDDEHGQMRCVMTLEPMFDEDHFAEGVMIDVIFLNCPVFERISKLPCTLSEAWLTESGDVNFSCDFSVAVLNKVLYFRHSNAEYDEYEARMKSYFPDYRVEYAD